MTTSLLGKALRLPARFLTRQHFERLRWRATDPYSISVLFALGLVAGGFAALALGWRGAAATPAIAIQLSYVVSGAAGGLALIAVGLRLLRIQRSRKAATEERLRMKEVLAEATRLELSSR